MESPIAENKPKGLVCGILSIVFSFLAPLVGVILGTIGAVRGHSCEKKAGFITSVIGLALSVCFWALYILVFVAAEGL